MITRILVATDGSAHGRKAVDHAATLAARFAADLIVTHVLLRGEYSENMRHLAEIEYLGAEGGKQISEAFGRVPEGRFPSNVVVSTEKVKTPFELLAAMGTAVLDEAEAAARKAGVKNVEKRLEDGDPVRRILEVADAENVDLIVTGARGLSQLKRLLVGSVSQKLSQLSPVSCLVVH